MHYQGPDRADLDNVFMLNRAFIAWLRAGTPGLRARCGTEAEMSINGPPIKAAAPTRGGG